MREVKIAIAGAGVIGRWHAKVISEVENARLVAVIDTLDDRAAALAAAYDARSFTTLAEAASEIEFDAVAVCTPSGTHGVVALEALDLGKHVLIEKPIDVTLEMADRIATAQKEADKVVTVISQHRFDPGFERVEALVNASALGRLTSAAATIAWFRGDGYFESADWRGTWALDGGGAFMNQGVHAVDLMLALLGPAIEVVGYTGTLAHKNIEVEDAGVAAVRFKSGALATILATTAAYPNVGTRLQIHGASGSAVFDDDQLTYVHIAEGESATSGGRSNQPGLIPPTQIRSEYATKSKDSSRFLSDSHHEQYANFIEAILTGATVRVGVAEARAAIELILAIYESQRTHCPVQLS